MEINYSDLGKLGNYEIIDVRENDKYLKRHLNKAINICFDYLIIYPERYLTKNKNYLLVCDIGIKSKKTSEILNNNGYHTYSLKGGMKDLFLE